MEEIRQIMPSHLRDFVQAAFEQSVRPEEIRMRVGQPLMLDNGYQELFWNAKKGCLTEQIEKGCCIGSADIQGVVNRMSSYSLYAFEEQIRQGYLTIPGGHRIGLAGGAVCHQGQIQTLRYITYLNIRIAGELPGCADEIMAYIRNGQRIYNTLILSPPGAGKTTLLRDMIRQLSKGTEGQPGKKVAVVDERGELAACYLGIPQNDLGPRTDVLEGCSKAQGMELLVRSMSPQVIGVDELGGQADYEAVEYALHCGCQILGTIHGEQVTQLRTKPYLSDWLKGGFFQRYLFLQRTQRKERKIQIYDERLELLC